MTTVTASDFSISSAGNLRTASGSTVYSTLDLHQWLQDLADNSAPSGDDLVSILGTNPSELAGKRNVSRPMALTLLNGVNIDDATAQRFSFGSIEQTTGNYLYTGLKTIGSIVAASPIYVYQGTAKVTAWWGTGHIQVLMKAKTGATLISTDSVAGQATVYSRKYGQSYSHFDVTLSAGGEQSAALSTALDGGVNTAVITPAIAAGYFSTAIGGTATPGSQKITIAYGDVTNNLGGGQGALLHKGTITLNGSITVAQAYQALMWAASEYSTVTFDASNLTQGWRYRVLPGQAYAENAPAPFGSLAGGKWFVAQGWWLAGAMAADSQNYQLTSHTGVTELPPNSITISVGGVVSGDYVLVARDTGSDINKSEYTVSGTSGATTISVTGLAVDTPASGVIRINGDRYTYTGWTGTTLSGLSPALTQTYSAVPAFIPMIDGVAAGSSITSAAMQFSAGFTARYRVRNGGGSPIVPFESTLAVTTTGGSGTAVRNADA